MKAETIRAAVGALQAGLEPLKALPPVSLGDWAAEHFRLSPEASHSTGGWAAYPFQLAWQDAFSDDEIEEVTIRKAKRTGYTKCLLAFIAYNAAHRRRKQALWQPTDDDRDSFVKSEVEPLLRDLPVMQPVMRARARDDTMRLKLFHGSVLHTLGGKATRAYRRITVDVAMLDEADGFDQQIEKSADPVTLARGRLEGAPFPKLIVGSTPRIKGSSHVEHRELQADARMQFHVTCPHCDLEHPLRFGGPDLEHGFKWDAGDFQSVRHVCPHCHEAIGQADYLRIWHDGAWVDAEGRFRYGPDRIWRDADCKPCRAPRHVAFHIWAAYSPQRDWSDIVREFIEANAKAKTGDTGPLQGFRNETLGEVWEVRSDTADEHELMQRPRSYGVRTVPPGALMLVAGVDVQDDRFEVVVWGIGRGEQMFAIDYTVITADPGSDADWLKLDAYLGTKFARSDGAGDVGIAATAIDTGGHHTHAVYGFCRRRSRLFAVKGSNYDGKPIKGRSSVQDINWRGRIIRNGVKLWTVGTDTAKDLLHARLKVREPGPGYVNFAEGLPRAFFDQLTSEGRVRQRTASGEVWRWVKKTPSARNEVLDATVYALFAAHMLDLNRYTGPMWDRLERRHASIAVITPKAGEETDGVAAVATSGALKEAEKAAALPPTKKRGRMRGGFGIASPWTAWGR